MFTLFRMRVACACVVASYVDILYRLHSVFRNGGYRGFYDRSGWGTNRTRRVWVRNWARLVSWCHTPAPMRDSACLNVENQRWLSFIICSNCPVLQHDHMSHRRSSTMISSGPEGYGYKIEPAMGIFHVTCPLRDLLRSSVAFVLERVTRLHLFRLYQTLKL